MSKRIGVSRPVSHFRRLVVDLMSFSATVPSVTIERRMRLGALVAARNALSPRPSWTAIFVKAFSRIAAQTPALRTSYMKFPWPRFYEHPTNIATLNIDRTVNDERVVLYVHVRSPENRTLAEIDTIIRHHKDAPVADIKSYQRAVNMSRVPWPFRQLAWWGALNVFGRRRCHNFGTFGTTSIAAMGAGVTKIIPLLTSTLHYGLFDEFGTLDMRLSFDHRVLDGATAAQALADLETVLLGELQDELRPVVDRAAA